MTEILIKDNYVFSSETLQAQWRNEPLSYGTWRIEYFWSFTLKRKRVSTCSSSSVTIFILILCRWKYHSDQVAELERLWVLICSGRVNDCQKMYLTSVKTRRSQDFRLSRKQISEKQPFRFKWSLMVDVICMRIQEKRMFDRLTTSNELVCRQEVTEEAFSRSLPLRRTITLGSPVLHFFHPTIPPSSTSKGDRMDFVFRDVAIRDEPNPPTHPPIHLNYNRRGEEDAG